MKSKSTISENKVNKNDVKVTSDNINKNDKQSTNSKSHSTLPFLFLFTLISSLLICSIIMVFNQVKISKLSKNYEMLENENKELSTYISKTNKDYQMNLGMQTDLSIDSIPESNERVKLVPYISENHLDSILDNIFYPYKTHIFKTLEEFEFVRDNIGDIHLKMLYSSTLHKDTTETFQSKTNQHHMLILIETTNGNRFGGYTSDNFIPPYIGLKSTGTDVLKYDSSAFLFNLDTKNIYNIRDKSNAALFCDDSFTISFGEGDLMVWNNFLTEGGSSTFPENFGDFSFEPFELTGGERSFQIKYLEAYHVEFFADLPDTLGRKGKYADKKGHY